MIHSQLEGRSGARTRAIALLLAGVAALLSATGPSTAGPPPARSATYRIDVRLDPAERRLDGRLILRWTNTTSASTDRMPLHLYLNAFRNNRSTLWRESNRPGGRRWAAREDEWGWIEVDSVRTADGRDLTTALAHSQPDDGNPDDRTVLVVPLEPPLEPGQSIQLDIAFTARLPHAFARTGFWGDFFFVAQWYPKPGVFRGAEGWVTPQFHASTEFFAEFADFEVAITLPQGYVVGATGRAIGVPHENPDGTVRRLYAEQGVHDFAWAADPDFVVVREHFVYQDERDVEQERELATVLGLEPADLALTDVEITLLLQPEHAWQAERILAAARTALRDFGYRWGGYPYPTLTIVDPQKGAEGAAGMEYPTLITIGSKWLSPAWSLRPEGVTIHEVGHQFWYGLVASNEFEEAWLDEGITTYATGRLLDRVYGPRTEGESIAGIPVPWTRVSAYGGGPARAGSATVPGWRIPPLPWSGGDRSLARRLGLFDTDSLSLLRDQPWLTAHRPVKSPALELLRPGSGSPSHAEPFAQPGWSYASHAAYRSNAYNRPALLLHTLERVLGAPTMAQVMRRFHQRFRFEHPRSEDFVRTAEEVSGRKLRALLDPFIQGNGTLDYAVAEVSVRRESPERGVFGQRGEAELRGGGDRKPGQPPAAAPAEEEPEGYVSEILLRRLGSVQVPVVVELEMEDGTTEQHSWDGKARSHLLRIEGEAGVRRATVDPRRIYVIDTNWANNRRAAVPDHRPAAAWSVRFLLWVQSFLAHHGSLS